MSTPTVRHPLFARFFDRLSRLMEREAGPERDELLAGLSGRVVEIGAGNGINFGHYPPQITELVAVEPEPYMRAKAQQSGRAAPMTVSVQDGVAERLPLDDASCDAAVACLVLCTVPDASAALAELRRVLRPGGELRFMEHVRSEQPRKAKVQKWFDRSGVWPKLGGGCHCARDTVGTITAAGFELDRVHRFTLGPQWGITNPHVRGSARRPGQPD